MMNYGWTGILIPRPTNVDQRASSVGRPPSKRLRTSGAAIAFLALLSAGCADASHLFLSSGPTPRVEDCMTLQQATPTKYVCDGKTYTSLQLADIRKATSNKKQ